MKDLKLGTATFYSTVNDNTQLSLCFIDEGGYYVEVSGKVSINEDEVDVFADWLKEQFKRAKGETP